MQLRHLLFAVSLCTTAALHAQDLGSGNSISSLEAGYTTFRPYALNSYLPQTVTATPFTSLLTFGYSGAGSSSTKRGGTYDAAVALHFFMPQENVIIPDTLKYRVGGWELMTSVFGFDVLKNVRSVDFTVAPGVYWGTMRLRKYNSAGNFKANELFKNPFVAPMIRADLRINLGPVTLGGRWSYRYDITKARWRKGDSETFPGYRSRELQYMVYIGWRFNWKD